MQLLISKDADSLWLPIIDIGAHGMGLNGLNGSSRPMCNSSLSLSYETAIYFQIYYALHSACCVLLLLLPFSLSLPYALRFVCKSSPNSKLPRALFFFFLSFLCGGCRLNSSSSSSCYGLLLLLFPSLKYTMLSCKFSFSTSIQKPQQLNVSLFLFPTWRW